MESLHTMRYMRWPAAAEPRRSSIRWTAFGKTSPARVSFAPSQFSRLSVSSGNASASHLASPARSMMRSKSLKFLSTAVRAAAGGRRKSIVRRAACAAATRTVFAEGVGCGSEATPTSRRNNKAAKKRSQQNPVFMQPQNDPNAPVQQCANTDREADGNSFNWSKRREQRYRRNYQTLR